MSHCVLSLSDFNCISAIWEEDGVRNILFNARGMRLRILNSFSSGEILDHYESHHGFREYSGRTIKYLGILETLEGRFNIYEEVVNVG